jgi:uncharacterized protein YkwD
MTRLRIYWFLYVALALASTLALTVRAEDADEQEQWTLHYSADDELASPTNCKTEIEAVVCYINAFRAENHLAPVHLDTALTRRAQSWSETMAQSNMKTNIEHSAFLDRHVAENIGYNLPTARIMVDEWIKSPPHRADMLVPWTTKIGVGVARDRDNGKYWTADFAK